MALNFPNSPSINEIYEDSATGFSYQWDGTFWKTYVANKLTFNENDYIKAGSTGNINSTGIITATTVKSSTLNLSGIPTYADETAATSGGAATGDVYKTSTGELRIKL